MPDLATTTDDTVPWAVMVTSHPAAPNLAPTCDAVSVADNEAYVMLAA